MKQAKTGDRTEIERALSPSLRSALDEFCSLYGIPRDRWQEVPALVAVFETAAVQLKVAELLRRPRYVCSQDFCERLAADSLGVEAKTVGSRLWRWRAMTRGTSR